jgi:hypothetical protein
MLRIPLLLLVVTVSQAATPVFKASFDNAEQKAKADLPKANINPCEASALAHFLASSRQPKFPKEDHRQP